MKKKSKQTSTQVVKLKKDDLLDELLNSLNDKHWDIICKLLGREISESKTTRKNLLGKLFKKTIKVSSRKGKARELQNWACEQISKLVDIPWGTEDDYEIRPRQMGMNGPDAILSPRVRSFFPLTPECKNQESWNLTSYIQQAKTNCYSDTDWLLLLSKNNHEEIAILDALVLFKLLKGK
jgi:hypothetical protein